MNKELKFRIWDKQYCHWLENSSSLHCYSNWTICPFTGNLVDYVETCDENGENFSASPANDYYWEDGKLIKEPRYITQQYTGLKDSKGVEIYEGDFVKALPATRYGMGIDQGQYDYMLLQKPKIVLYFDGSYKLFDKIPHNKSDLVENFYIDANIEVIGNIFENPELIKTNE
jgi:uncharacterized phage protein (TIGR01671 family)